MLEQLHKIQFFDEAMAAHLFKQVVDGLAYMHR